MKTATDGVSRDYVFQILVSWVCGIEWVWRSIGYWVSGMPSKKSSCKSDVGVVNSSDMRLGPVPRGGTFKHELSRRMFSW